MSFHAVSFIQIENDKIVCIDEYWGDDGNIPEWRIKMNIGQKYQYGEKKNQVFEEK